jgi:hypothetical protein
MRPLGVAHQRAMETMVAHWLDSPETKRIKASIDWHLSNISDDRALRERLEGMLTGAHSKALWWYWAPQLYARNRAAFRPLIQHSITEHFVDPTAQRPRWEHIEWKGDVARSLDPWLAVLEKEGELKLFRSLYTWKHRPERGWKINSERWRNDVRERFATASPATRVKVLQLYDMTADLDESTAVALYDVDASQAGPFILKHLPTRWLSSETKRQLWQQLAQRARRAGDEDFVFKLYRQQIPLEDWTKETLQLCATLADNDELSEALEKRHPQGLGDSLGLHFHKLLEARGLDLLPYLRKHLRNVFAFGRKNGYTELVTLARTRGWTELWAAVVVTCGNTDHYNAAVRAVLEDKATDEPERLRRLGMLSGVSREWNGIGWGLARVQQLTEQNALSLYERYPELIRHAYKAHVTPAWRENYFDLFERAWDTGDEELADYLASRYATRAYVSEKTKAGIADIVAEKYVALKLDETAFARRAASVLTRIPAYSIFNYGRLIRANRLARLLFERSLRKFLEVPEAVRDLVEGSEIHVQHLAYRVLALDDPRAATQASENLEIIIGTLLRPLHRTTRLAAFAALANAANSSDDARLILTKAREAFVLPDQRYPKEQLVGLIGKILARHPELASPAERPVIYRRVARAGAGA